MKIAAVHEQWSVAYLWRCDRCCFLHSRSFCSHSSAVSITSSAFFDNASSYFMCRSWYSPLMKHVLHSSLFSSLISICEQKLKYWAAKRKIQPFNNPVQNHLRYLILYVRLHWIPILFVVKTTLVHLLPTLHAMCAFTLCWDGVFSYLQCSWIVQECFEPGMSFIICSNNIWQPFFALLKNYYAWTIAVFTTNPSIIVIAVFTTTPSIILKFWLSHVLEVNVEIPQIFYRHSTNLM